MPWLSGRQSQSSLTSTEDLKKTVVVGWPNDLDSRLCPCYPLVFPSAHIASYSPDITRRFTLLCIALRIQRRAVFVSSPVFLHVAVPPLLRRSGQKLNACRLNWCLLVRVVLKVLCVLLVLSVCFRLGLSGVSLFFFGGKKTRCLCVEKFIGLLQCIAILYLVKIANSI